MQAQINQTKTYTMEPINLRIKQNASHNKLSPKHQMKYSDYCHLMKQMTRNTSEQKGKKDKKKIKNQALISKKVLKLCKKL